MFRFEHLEYFYALLLIPFILLIFILYMYWKRRAVRHFGESEVVSRLMPMVSANRPVLKIIFFILAYTFLVIAIANPQVGSKLVKAKREGSDLVIALDVSNSMLAEDIRPNRLTRAKQSISKLIDKLEGDRVGIVIFAGKAYTQLPITTDYSAAKMFLENISTDNVPTQGTAIGDAIDMAMTSFKEDDKRGKAIIIITDGEDHEGNAVESAKKAEEKGIRIYTIGMGTPEGAPIPIYDPNGNLTGYKKDRQGQTVISKLDENMLQQIASAGDGSYIRASNSRDGLKKIFDDINSLQKSEIETRMYSEYEDRFQYFLGLGLIFLIMEFLIGERKSKWAHKIKLFNR